jgi:hypothetical protein
MLHYEAIMTRIPLPAVSHTGQPQAHPFPIQVAYQTQEFLQGALFHAIFADIAAGEFVHLPNGVERIEQLMASKGLVSGTSDEAWLILRKYESIFGGVLFQSVLVSLCSHWDWYIRRLAEFVSFARRHVDAPALSKGEARDLERIDRLSFENQVRTIAIATGVDLELAVGELETLAEMALVRNLGLHNRWEVDDTYLAKTKTVGLVKGDLRAIASAELGRWHQFLILVLNRSALEVAKHYRAVPQFEI